MKSILSFVLAGLIGGLICFGAIEFTGNKWLSHPEVKNVSLTSPVTTGPDFALAAEMAQKAVVLIEAQESKASAQQRYRQQDPMAEMLERFGLGNGFSYGFGPLIRKGAGSE